MNDLYDTALITLGATGVGFVKRKAFKDGLSTLGIKYAQKKKWLPVDPFKS